MREGYLDQVLKKMNQRSRKFGEEWPSSDSEDPDYSPCGDQKKNSASGSESGSSTEEDVQHKTESAKRKRNVKSQALSAKKNSVNDSKEVLQETAVASPCSVKNNKRHKKLVKRQKVVKCQPARPSNTTLSQGNSTLSDSTCRVQCPHLPPELWLKVFQNVVKSAGPLPFLSRAALVCRSWHEMTSHPSLWYKVDLSYGWINSTDSTLLWLSQHRLTHCREISLSGWKKLTNSALIRLSQNCRDLCTVSLSRCEKLSSSAVLALATNCSNIQELDLSSMSTDAVSNQSLKQVTQQLGASLKSLIISGNHLRGFNSVLNSLMDHCKCLEKLDLSNCTFSTDVLTLNIEHLQASCPLLRVLQLTGCQVWAARVPQHVQKTAPGFTKLEQLGCTCSADDTLRRFLHNARQLKVLDIRRSTSFSPETLLHCAASDVEELFLSQTSISVYSEMLEPIFLKWKHSLRSLDLAGTIAPEEHLLAAIAVLAEFPDCPLEYLDLASSSVTVPVVRLALQNLRHLETLDLTLCRAMPRGTKCLHQGRDALRKLQETLQETA